MFRASQRPSSEVPKTVSATSGIGHGIGTTTSFHRGLIRTAWLHTDASSWSFLLTLNQGRSLKIILDVRPGRVNKWHKMMMIMMTTMYISDSLLECSDCRLLIKK
jgi:hypothetical protein